MQIRSLLPACLSLLLATGALAEPAAPPANPLAKWEPEVAAFQKNDAEKPAPTHAVLFLGSSSIRFWTDVAKDFPHHRVVNRGFGGSMISDSIGLADRLVFPYEPRMIVFYAGGNDINGGKSPETVAADFRTFAETVHARLPKTDIAFISIAPNPNRWAQVEKVKTANAAIEAYCKETPHLKFIDVFPHMLGPDGQPKEGIFRDDQLHMNAEGYKIWVEVVKPFLPTPDLPANSRPKAKSTTR
jgi:lysophospholipase L1-like esterase